MTDYTITLTNEQDIALDTIVSRVNDQRASEIPPKESVTKDQYLKKRISNVVDSYVTELNSETHTSVKDAYKNADDTTKTQIKTLLGL